MTKQSPKYMEKQIESVYLSIRPGYEIQQLTGYSERCEKSAILRFLALSAIFI